MKTESRTVPAILLDQADDGYAEQWAWVSVDAAATEADAIKLLTAEVGVPDEFGYQARGRVWLAPEFREPPEDMYERWLPSEPAVDGAAEFWHIEVVEA